MLTPLQAKKLRISLQGLIIFDRIQEDPITVAFCDLLKGLEQKTIDKENVYTIYHHIYKIIQPQSWIEYLVAHLCHGQNAVVLLDPLGKDPQQAETIKDHVARDLCVLQELAQVSADDLLQLIDQGFRQEPVGEDDVYQGRLAPLNWPCWQHRTREMLTPSSGGSYASRWLALEKQTFISRLILQENWGTHVHLLLEYYRKVGYGEFGSYAAFALSNSALRLEGIESPDPISLKNLICQEREQKIVLENTLSFLKGYPANNVILYGNRGTGKSSLVKALLNEYIDQGLRIVQLKKHQIGAFPGLVKDLAEIPLKFIVFIDDLSFNDVEEDYKNLKSLLEGGVEARPRNVLVYATSNRKHLVKESFTERRTDDIHAKDNMEEKLSLADRFGITVTFLSPDQESFIKIVEVLATQSGIHIDAQELRQRALQWVLMHNGRSGRTARQFVDHLIGGLAQQPSYVLR